jgi:thrombospondin type 3 repeat protein
MNTHGVTGRRIGIAILCASFLASAPVQATLTTNSWNGFIGGSWQSASSWSLTVPPSTSQSAIMITNTFLTGSSKTITIDGNTATNFASTMTVSNLVVLGAPGLGGDPPLGQNILFLNGAANVPLTVLNSLVVSNDGVVFVTNSILNANSTELIGGLGTMFLTSGTNSTGTLTIGDGANAAALWMDGGTLLASSLTINSGALFAQSNGTVNISGSDCDVEGNWVLAAGTQTVALFIGLGSTPGTATMTGGQLLGGLGINLDQFGINLGTMVISNGQVNLGPARVGRTGVPVSDGTLTIAGGTVSFESLQIGAGTGTLWMTGGSLQITNDYLSDGINNGTLIQSNGTMALFGEIVGELPTTGSGIGTGTLTLAGGVHTIGTAGLTVGSFATGTVWLTGGHLIGTNGYAYLGYGGVATMAVSNGTWMARDVYVGTDSSEGTLTILGGTWMASDVYVGTDSGEGTLTILGGITTISSNLTLGDCGAGSVGHLFLKDGYLFITNSAHNATLDVRNDTVLITGGHLIVDRVVMTNDCGLFIHAGGTVSVGSELLDPNLDADNDGLPNGWEIAHGLDPLDSIGVNGADGDPDGDGYSNMQEYLAGSDPRNPLSTPLNPSGASFAFTSLVRSGNDIVLTWSTTGGTTNQVQVSPGTVNGSYTTNGFVNLGAQMLITGSGTVITNFTDTNGATNKPARYYRIRLVP